MIPPSALRDRARKAAVAITEKGALPCDVLGVEEFLTDLLGDCLDRFVKHNAAVATELASLASIVEATAPLPPKDRDKILRTIIEQSRRVLAANADAWK